MLLSFFAKVKSFLAKSSFFILIFSLILSTFANVVKNTTPTFAASSYTVNIYGQDNNIIASGTLPGDGIRNMAINTGGSVEVRYRIDTTDSDATKTTDLMGYCDVMENGSISEDDCSLYIYDKDFNILASIPIPRESYPNIQTEARIETIPDGNDCGASSACIRTTLRSIMNTNLNLYYYNNFWIADIPNDVARSTVNTGGSSTPTTTTDATTATCYTSAGGIGWIACVLLDGAAGAINWFYENAIEPSLRTRTELFNSSENGGSNTYSVWTTFRDIANILFGIFLMVIIFSQLTGIGIDNYGIKKSLPKLIIAAILVNLSYYACELLIDLSNIVGSGVYSMFINMANSVTVSDATLQANGLAGNGVAATAGVVVLVAASITAGALFAHFAGGAGAAIASILFPLLSVIATAFVSFLFMVFLLSMRQAVVVILVILSPLAFACYLLPNTKRTFDRWVDLLKGMLILYPTCGVLMGGGRLVSRILLSTAGNSDFFMLMVAMLAEIAPIFAIPSVVRAAYRATGMLGARLNGLSTRWSRGAGMRVRNSRPAREAAQRGQERAALARAQRISSRFERAKNRGSSFGTREAAQRRAAEANKLLTQADQAALERNNWTNQEYIAGQRGKQKINNERDLLDAQNWGNDDYQQYQQRVAQENATKEIAKAKASNVAATYTEAEFKQATINEANIAATNERDRVLNWANDDYATGKSQAAQLANERDQQETGRLADADYAKAVRTQQMTENAEKFENQLVWNNGAYVRGHRERSSLARENEAADTRLYDSATNPGYTEGKREAATINRQNEAQNTILYTNPDYAQSRRRQGELTRDLDVKRSALYNNDDYIRTRESQNTAVVANETVKMYKDQFDRQSSAELQTTLQGVLQNTATPNRTEQISAAIQTLMSRGSEKETLLALSDSGASAGLASSMSADSNFRNLVSQQLLSSGNTILKEYGKHVSKAGDSAVGFEQFLDGTGPDDSLHGALHKKGDSALVGMNKDNLEILSAHPNAVAALSDKTFVNAAASTTNGEEITRLTNIIGSLESSKRDSIASAITPTQFVNMHENIRVAINNDPSAFASITNELKKPENATLAAKLTDAERTRYGIAP